MSTIASLLDEVDFLMHSYTGVREQITFLSANVDEVGTDLSVAHGDRVTRGLIEVDDELMMVSEVDDTGNVRLFPFGRGQSGSSAVSHTAEARVTNDPFFPRISVLNAVKSVLGEVHPELFQVKSTDIVFNPAVYAYELPDDTDRILSVSFDVPGPAQVWPRLYRWRFDRDANTTDFPSGKSLQVSTGVVSGYKMHVTYAAPYGPVVTGAEPFVDLGIQESVKDVLMYGAAWRLAQSGEAARIQMHGVTQMALQEAVSAGSATKLAQQFYALYNARLMDERKKLLDLHPMQIHRTW